MWGEWISTKQRKRCCLEDITKFELFEGINNMQFVLTLSMGQGIREIKGGCEGAPPSDLW